MKKLIIISVGILVGLYIVLSLVSSKAEYAAERLFYRAAKKYDKIKLNPDVPSPRMLASVEKDLQKLIKKYPKTEVAKASYITLAELYLLDKKYDKAVEALDEFISMHSDSSEDKDTVLLSRAHFLKAGAYEKLDREKEALAEFAILKEEFANTPLGLQTPLYIAHYHKREGREGVAEEEYNNAVEFYIELEEKNRKTMFGYAASNLLVQTYIALDKYEEAGKVVQDTISNYPSTMTLVQQLPYVELIYLKALNNPDKAIEIYSAILKNTKDPKIKKYLEEKIKSSKSRED
jgi:tetratricopeptide (TPR) repeat protein